MTTPIVTINPSKAKTWVAAIGAILTVAVPPLLSVSPYLPDPWPAVIGGFIGLLTVLGVYKAPYKPKGTSVVSTADLNEIATPIPPPEDPEPPVIPPAGPAAGWDGRNPWKT